MPVTIVNGISLNFEEYGKGEPVVLIPGTGVRGRVWKAHQVPALVAAGYRAITIDNRGIPPSDVCEEGFTLADVVADTAGLIEDLGLEPCNVIGSSMGSVIAQELLVVRPELVKSAVLMATRGRLNTLGRESTLAAIELFDSGVKLPVKYEAYIRVVRGFSPRTLYDEELVRDWLEVFEMSDSLVSRSQLELDLIPNRLESYRSIQCPCLVVAFEDDLVVPPHMCREVADSIPGSKYEQIAGCGHYGYIERPVAVNETIVNFFADVRDCRRGGDNAI